VKTLLASFKSAFKEKLVEKYSRLIAETKNEFQED
jgi:hypothetical protein